MSTQLPAIKTLSLSKYYGRSVGIEALDLEVGRNEVFGFLGPNGSGKTTTIRLLLDLLRPSSGHAEILGLDTARDSLAIRRKTGYLPGDVSLYSEMTANELLSLVERVRRRDCSQRKKALAERLEIDLRVRIRAASRGMKQKIAVILAFMHDPELLVLDEPTVGLDPLMQREFYALILEEKAAGKAIFLSSHVLTEVERVCDRIGIVRAGRLVDVESVSDLKRKKVRRMELTLGADADLREMLGEGVELLRRVGNRVELAVSGNVGDLIKRLARLPIEDIVFPEATLEDTFMKFYHNAHTDHEHISG